MPSTSDLPWAGKGPSGKTRSSRFSTDSGHFPICFLIISPLVLKPWRHKNRGFLRPPSLPIISLLLPFTFSVFHSLRKLFALSLLVTWSNGVFGIGLFKERENVWAFILPDETTSLASRFQWERVARLKYEHALYFLMVSRRHEWRETEEYALVFWHVGFDWWKTVFRASLFAALC